MPTGRASTTDARALARLYARVRATTAGLCLSLEPEDMVVQSMPDASPAKWHLAHTSWFFETFLLGEHLRGYQPFDPRFPALFNSYYHAAGERFPRPERGLLSRPTVREILAYRAHVDRGMHALLEEHSGELEEATAFLVELGLNHEEQHQELLLTDVKHMLARNPLEPPYRTRAIAERSSPRPSTADEWACFDGGLVELGARPEGFAFDNERPRHRHWLEPFELRRRPVSCAEYLEFVEAGGYRQPEHWLSDGWDALAREGWEAPLYWRREGTGWSVFTLDGARPLQPDEPVCHISYYEADAYARWRGARLPLEAEWEHAAGGEALVGNLLESDALHPRAARESGLRLDQAFGDVWEWTASPYAPYPGFQVFQGSVGEYNGKWMSHRWVLRGGSCVTPGRHLRPSYRNFFGSEARWQFSGLRLARALR